MFLSDIQSKIDLLRVNREIHTSDPKLLQGINAEIQNLQIQKMEFCDDQIERAKMLYEDGDIGESLLNDTISSMSAVIEDALPEALPYYTEAASALAFLKVAGEVGKFVNLGTKVFPTQIGKLISAPNKAYAKERLSNYNIIFTDAIAFNQLTSEVYNFDEISKKPNLNRFKYGKSWFESGIRTNVKVFSYNDKAVCAICYTKPKDIFQEEAGIETAFYDSKFKRHEDYYIACMALSVEVSHPAINRTLERLKKAWESEASKQKTEIKESVEEAILHGQLEEKMSLIEEACEEGMIDTYTRDFYKEYVEAKSILLK